ncbi:MAG: hypothetical protein ACK4IX_10340 [Candidatus Sericytochromatia bacterium]
MKENKTIIKNLLTLTSIMILISACNNEVSKIKPEPSPSKTIEVTNVSDITEIAKNEIIKPSFQEEEDIKKLIESSTDLISLDTENDQDTLEATVPNNGGVVFATVLNNGGVVFNLDDSNNFSTKGILSEIKERVDSQSKAENNPSTTIKPTNIVDKLVNKVKKKVLNLKSLPKQWGRKVIGEPTKEYKISFNEQTKEVEAILTTTYDIEITIKRDTKTVTKKQKETKVSKVSLQKVNGKWTISKIGSGSASGSDSNNKIIIEYTKVIVESKDNTGTIVTKSYMFKNNELIDKDKVIKISNGDFITLEVKAINKNDNSENNLIVFAKPSHIKVRVPVLDDGGEENPNAKSGDATKDDSIFTTNLSINTKASNYFLNITATTDNSIADDTEFASATMSIPIKIK